MMIERRSDKERPWISLRNYLINLLGYQPSAEQKDTNSPGEITGGVVQKDGLPSGPEKKLDLKLVKAIVSAALANRSAILLSGIRHDEIDSVVDTLTSEQNFVLLDVNEIREDLKKKSDDDIFELAQEHCKRTYNQF